MSSYFHSGYFHANYWHANYFVATASTTGDYWHSNYWATGYWNANYWLNDDTAGTVVAQNNAVQLSLTTFVTVSGQSLNVLPGTEGLTLTPLASTARLDIDPAVTLATRSLTGFNASVGVEGYQLGDIDVRFIPDSTTTVTYGVIGSLPTLDLVSFSPTVQVGSDVSVAATKASLSLTTNVTDSSFNIAVEPLPASLSLASYQTVAGLGTQVSVPLQSLSFNVGVQAIVATNATNDVFPAPVSLSIESFNAEVIARQALTIPPSSFLTDLIQNLDATTDVPVNYVICDRTGFKVKPGELVEEWTGVKVRRQSYERRHPQDYVRSKPERQRGSERPEQADVFIENLYPNGVTADDL